MEKSAKKNVVVVGGGMVGGLVVRELSKKLSPSQYNIILVNERPFYVHLMASARMAVTAEDQIEDRALYGFDKLFYNGNGTVKVGKVVSVAEAAPGKGGEVVLEDGERIPYAALVLATGAKWPSFIELPRGEGEARSHLNSWRKKFETAQHVVIVGGGAVGLELAGEVRQSFPSKGVTLIHKGSKLLNATYPDKFRDDIERRVRARNIDVILGDAVESVSEEVSGLTTQNGKSIPDADLLVQAFGSKPNTEFVSSLGEGLVNSYGYVKVTEHLEVAGHPGVFAVGDIIDWKEQKQAAKGRGQLGVVTTNLMSFLNNTPLKSVYKGSPEFIVIPLGKTGGAAYMGIFGGFMLGDFVTRLAKAKGLMIDMVRGQRGL